MARRTAGCSFLYLSDSPAAASPSCTVCSGSCTPPRKASILARWVATKTVYGIWVAKSQKLKNVKIHAWVFSEPVARFGQTCVTRRKMTARRAKAVQIVVMITPGWKISLIWKSRVTPGGASFRNRVCVWLDLYAVEVSLQPTNGRTMGHKLYQGIKANRTTDDTPSRAKSKGNETLFLQRRDKITRAQCVRRLLWYSWKLLLPF